MPVPEELRGTQTEVEDLRGKVDHLLTSKPKDRDITEEVYSLVPQFRVETVNIDPPNISAQSAVQVTGSIDATQLDTVIVIGNSGGWSFVFVTEPSMTADGTVNVLVRNYSGAGFDPGPFDVYFLVIEGLDGP